MRVAVGCFTAERWRTEWTGFREHADSSTRRSIEHVTIRAGGDHMLCMGVVVHPGRLRQEMARRAWSAVDLARESRLSQATISAALAGRPIAAQSLGLIAEALTRVPALDVIDSLVMVKGRNAQLE